MSAGNEAVGDEAQCPLEGCDYTGNPRSVEAHVSSKRDELHTGEVGRLHREAIEESAERAESVDELAEETGNELPAEVDDPNHIPAAGVEADGAEDAEDDQETGDTSIDISGLVERAEAAADQAGQPDAEGEEPPGPIGTVLRVFAGLALLAIADAARRMANDFTNDSSEESGGQGGSGSDLQLGA